ncbi:MAG: hypothetical protein ACFFD4_31700 [Candidatus Odinarchaeota archaeon]
MKMDLKTIENEKLEMPAEIKKRAKERIDRALENHRLESELLKARMKTSEELEQEEQLLASIASKLNIEKEVMELVSIKKARGKRWNSALEKLHPKKKEEG